MFTTLIIFQVLVAAGLIAIVLVQRGPGATMGAAFGSGASGTVFGSRGAGNFLTRTTGFLAVGFFGISLALAVLAAGSGDTQRSALDGSVLEEAAPETPPAEQQADPAVDSMIDSLDEPPAQSPTGEGAAATGDETDSTGEDSAAAGEGAAADEDEDDGGEPESLPEPPPGS